MPARTSETAAGVSDEGTVGGTFSCGVGDGVLVVLMGGAGEVVVVLGAGVVAPSANFLSAARKFARAADNAAVAFFTSSLRLA